MDNAPLNNTSVPQTQSSGVATVSSSQQGAVQQTPVPTVSLVPTFFMYGVAVILSLALVTVLSISNDKKTQTTESNTHDKVVKSSTVEDAPVSYAGTPAQEQYSYTTQSSTNQNITNTNTVAPISYEVKGPEVNKMSCLTPPKRGLHKGEIACYGVWDNGREFGDDAYMCPSNRVGIGDTGCVITTPACLSSSATAVTFVNLRENGIDRTMLAEVTKNLDTTDDVVLANVFHLWVYTCN